MTRATVLGGRGFIGGAVCDAFRRRGLEVFAPDRAEIADGALEGRDLGVVVYAIGLTGDFRTRPFDTVEAQICLLSRLLQTTRFERWLYLSSTRVYDAAAGARPSAEADALLVTPSRDALYNLTKLAAEALLACLADGRGVVARVANVFGPGQSAVSFLGAVLEEAARSGHVGFREAPDSAKDYIPLNDVAELLVRVALDGGAPVYNIASGASITHREIAAMLGDRGVACSFADGAALRRFPVVDMSRLRAEFGYEGATVRDQLDAHVERVLSLRRGA